VKGPDVIYLCISNAPAEAAPTIARELVEGRLAACVKILPGVRSIYRWKGEIHDDPESTIMIKTANVDTRFRARFLELHPYECPELVIVPITDGHSDYLRWVREMTVEGDDA